MKLDSVNTFTMGDALKYQAQHLAQWELVLKPEVMEKLRAMVLERNIRVTDPYEVCRGDAITMMVLNAQRLNLV